MSNQNVNLAAASIAPTNTMRADNGCVWAADEDGNWDTTCGNKHIIIDGGPVENSMRFCCYCGGGLYEGSAPPSSADSAA